MENKLDEISDKLDKLIQMMNTRFVNIENQLKNQDLSMETELTSGVEEFLESYATQNGFKFCFKTNKNYPSNIREPTNPKKTITNIDGSYILSNDMMNASVSEKSSIIIRPIPTQEINPYHK